MQEVISGIAGLAGIARFVIRVWPRAFALRTRWMGKWMHQRLLRKREKCAQAKHCDSSGKSYFVRVKRGRLVPTGERWAGPVFAGVKVAYQTPSVYRCSNCGLKVRR